MQQQQDLYRRRFSTKPDEELSNKKSINPTKHIVTMAIELDELIFNAIKADADLMAAVGGRVESTCFEVSPDETDNTPLPYIVIRDEGKRPANQTKDDDWMPSTWQVGAAIEIGAQEPKAVDNLAMMAMQAVNNYIHALYDQGEYIPNLLEGFPQTDGVQWDWMKPCYWDMVHYQCDVDNKLYDNGNN